MAIAQASRPATKKVTVSVRQPIWRRWQGRLQPWITGRNSSLTDYECRVTLYDQDGAAFTRTISPARPKNQGFGSNLPRQQHSPTVTLKDGGSLTQNQVQCVIDPENVEVIASDQAVLSDIKEINLGEIDLGSVHGHADLHVHQG